MTSDVAKPTETTTQFYLWQGYPCAYEVQHAEAETTPLLLVHPIGVGLSRRFWDRFCQTWFAAGHPNPIYTPDLLGCGESDMPHVAYTPDDWAEQLQHFLQTVIQRPVILVAQGALAPVAFALVQKQVEPNLVRGLILSGPPAWAVTTAATPAWQHRLNWNLFDSILGQGFYRYACRQSFLQSFSIRQLFADAAAVDQDWLNQLEAGAANPASRYAVFAFLAGFWRQDYAAAIAQIPQPTLVVIGDRASSISRSGQSETPEQRLADYLRHLPNGKGIEIAGRNVLPYESTTEFVRAIGPFVKQFEQQ
jgi:pimeloyl-ACP methyl ester carboxylesterase